MSNLNTVAISGNLTRDPELRHTPNGYAVCNLGVAVNRTRKDKDSGERIEETSFFDVVVWGGFGELCARKLRKADLVSVEGRLEQRRWEAEDGTKRSKVEIVANQVDGQGLYRSKDEETAPSDAYVQAAQSQLATASDDDIPF